VRTSLPGELSASGGTEAIGNPGQCPGELSKSLPKNGASNGRGAFVVGLSRCRELTQRCTSWPSRLTIRTVGLPLAAAYKIFGRAVSGIARTAPQRTHVYSSFSKRIRPPSQTAKVSHHRVEAGKRPDKGATMSGGSSRRHNAMAAAPTAHPRTRPPPVPDRATRLHPSREPGRPQDPASAGGSFWDPVNLRASCAGCNLRRMNQDRAARARLTKQPAPPSVGPSWEWL
jgi:hypothetical protein